MKEFAVRCLPVVDGAKVVGIVSDQDVFRLKRWDSIFRGLTVEDAMSEDIYAAELDDPADAVAAAMSESRCACSVVLDRRHRVEGVFTPVEGMKLLADVLRHGA